MQESQNWLKVQQYPLAAPPPSPFHSGFNEAALIFVVWVCVPLGIKLRTQEGRGWITYAVWSRGARVHVAPRHMHAAHLCCRVGFSQDPEEMRFLWF